MSDFWILLEAKVKKGEELKCSKDLQRIQTDLKDMLSKLYPNKITEIYVFGSRVMGLGTVDSDFDVIAEIVDRNCHHIKYSTSEELCKQNNVFKALQKSFHIWNNARMTNKKLPLVNVVHRPTGIECDISFSHLAVLGTTNLANYLLDLQPIARYLCIFLRVKFENYGLKESFRCTTIAFLVIFFLQCKKLLPSVEEMQRGIAIDIKCKPWITGFKKKSLQDLGISKININSKEVKKYLLGYVEFYENFDYNNIICPYLGTSMPENKFTEMMPLRYNLCQPNASSHFSFKSIMNIQEFIELNRNNAEFINQTEFDTFKKLLNKCKDL